MPVVEKIRSGRGFRVRCVCDQCGKKFERRLSQTEGDRTFCSRACCGTSRRKSFSKRVISIHTLGYEVVRFKGKQRLRHRLVMAEALGRELLPGEIVHHINGDRADNRPENLELRTCGEHGHTPGHIDANLKTINALLQEIAMLKKTNTTIGCDNLD